MKDLYIANITFDDVWWYGIHLTENPRVAFYKTIWDNYEGGAIGSNPGYISHGASGTGAVNEIITDSTFRTPLNRQAGSAILMYGVNKGVIEDNHFESGMDPSIAHKKWDPDVIFRHNTFDLTGAAITTQAYGSPGSSGEFAFNYIKTTSESSRVIYLFRQENIGPYYIYRNTIVGGDPTVWGLAESDGLIEVYNNVLINTLSDVLSDGSPPYCGVGDDWYENKWHWSNFSCAIYNDITDVYVHDNLKGVAADNIVDADGLLLGSYKDTYLGTHGWETPAVAVEILGSGMSGAGVGIQ
jgi:hypothetical protein